MPSPAQAVVPTRSSSRLKAKRVEQGDQHSTSHDAHPAKRLKKKEGKEGAPQARPRRVRKKGCLEPLLDMPLDVISEVRAT